MTLVSMGEPGFLTLLGALSGTALLCAVPIVGQPIIESRFGSFVQIGGPTTDEWILLGAVVAAGFLVGSVPGYRA